MSYSDVLLQQVINGVSLGAMYALLALGFTMVYGIIELINFAHFNVFMVGSFFAMWVLKLTGLVGQRVILTGLPLFGVLLLALVAVMLFCGVLGVVIERTVLRPLRNAAGTAAMITTIGVSYILFNIILLSQGAAALNYPNPMPNVVWKVAGADLHLREVLVWLIALLLMLGLNFFVRRTRMGKAMQATAQDQEAARMMGIEVDSVVMLTFFLGSALAGALFFAFAATMLAAGLLGVAIERISLRPLRGVPGTAAMITTIGVSYILFNIILLSQGAAALNYPNPMPNVVWKIAGADLHLREVLVWLIALLLMLGLNFFVRRTRMGKAMQATAQDQEAARMMGIQVDSVVMLTFFLGSALAGAAGLIFGLYYNFTSYVIGYTAGLRAFTAAVLGGIGSIPGAMLGGILIGLIESLGGQLIATRWTDVIIFSILILVLVFRPTGLLGRLVPRKS